MQSTWAINSLFHQKEKKIRRVNSSFNHIDKILDRCNEKAQGHLCLLSLAMSLTVNYKPAASLFLQVWRPHRPLLVLHTAKKISARLCLLWISMKSSKILWLLGKLVPLHNSSSQTLIPAWIPRHTAVETIVASFSKIPPRTFHSNLLRQPYIK